MHRPHVTLPFGIIVGSIIALAIALALVALLAPPAHGAPQSPQAFHLMEITKLMVGFNGNTNIQAVEMRMQIGGQNAVTGTTVEIYDGDGNLTGTLGAFTGSVPNGLAGDNLLCATALFQSTFGITADLTLTPGIPVTSGQVAFRHATCLVNSLAYGDVSSPLTGLTAAPPLPAGAATVLVRTTANATVPSCPLAEDSYGKFQLRSGTSAAPIQFRNNLRQTVNVFSTVAGVAEGSPARPKVLASPNPFTASTLLEFRSEPTRVKIYDVQGRTVRTWGDFALSTSGDIRPHQIRWDGRDGQGRQLPAGLYFVEAVLRDGPTRGRVLLLR